MCFALVVRGGSYLVMNCGDGLERSYARHGTLTRGFSPEEYRLATLAEPVEWWTEMLESGVWRYDPSTEQVEYAPAYVRALPQQQHLSGLV